MPLSFRIHAAWSPRSDSLDRVAQQCVLLMTALGSVHPALAGWQAERAKGGRVPVGDLQASLRTLEESAVKWTLGTETRTAHRPRFFTPPGGPVTAELTISSGATPLPLARLFAPNRLDLVIGGAVGDASTGPATIENALRAAVAVFRPDHGHAGTPTFPSPSASLFSDGRPAVGWMTYLSRAYPAVPPVLPRPATAEAVAHLGTLLIAHAELATDDDALQRAAVERLRATLDAAGVLVPAEACSSALQAEVR